MKITIELTEAEVKGIKAYLKEVDGTERPSKEDIKQFIGGEVASVLQAPQSSVADYIRRYENQ